MFQKLHLSVYVRVGSQWRQVDRVGFQFWTEEADIVRLSPTKLLLDWMRKGNKYLGSVS